jgi:hypothetical protein
MTSPRSAQQQRRRHRQDRHAQKARRQARRKPTRSFTQCLQHFLTPDVFQQAQKARTHDAARRWKLHPLVLVVVAMTWCCGDTVEERFETARALYVATHQKRKRPGQTTAGFQKALGRLPAACLRAVAAGVRRRLTQDLGAALVQDGFAPFGCDGSRVACPRTEELEHRLGHSGKEGAAPMLWVTAVVHLPTALLWGWRVGRGTADERGHLRQLLTLLPTGVAVLVVADAGYVGYEVAQAVVDAGADFLLRMSSRAYLYTERAADTELPRFREGLVYYWPAWAQKAKRPPLRVRLLRLRSPGKGDVWLLTSVLEKQRLRRRTASRFYRLRWRNEGLFRTYKRTLKKVTLQSRTVRLVHREAEASLVAVQLLLGQGVVALQRAGVSGQVSARGVLRAIRAALRVEVVRGLGPRQYATYEARLVAARVDERQRCSSKVKREWPRRVPHQPPKPPKLRTLTDKLKALMVKVLDAANQR